MNILYEEKRFNKDWEADFFKSEIRRRKFSLIRNLQEFIWPSQYPVLALYRWARGLESQPQNMSYPHIVNSDNLVPIKGIPSRIELNADWTIKSSDLRSLILGPLTKGDKVLVPALPKRMFLITIWRLVEIIATVGGVVTFFFFLFSDC
jgi:hypothetical protein